jgi:hypothetical protein
MQRLTVPLVDTFIEDLKDSVKEARLSPSGDGTMVQVYGSTTVYPFVDSVLTHVGMFQRSREFERCGAYDGGRVGECVLGYAFQSVSLKYRYTVDGTPARGW